MHKPAYDAKHGKGLKILYYKEMLQRLPIPLVQEKAGNASENLINENGQIIYSLYQLTEKLYTNIINSIKLWNWIYNILMNPRKSRISDPYRLLIKVTDKINLKIIDTYGGLSNVSIYYIWKNMKESYKSNEFKISAPTWNQEFELPDGPFSVSINCNKYLSKETIQAQNQYLYSIFIYLIQFFKE